MRDMEDLLRGPGHLRRKEHVLPQWIEEIITNVVVPPPPKHTRFCHMCGGEYETSDIHHIQASFCASCEPKYKQYCFFLNNYNYHEEQRKALDKVVYRYADGTGELLNKE